VSIFLAPGLCALYAHAIVKTQEVKQELLTWTASNLFVAPSAARSDTAYQAVPLALSTEVESRVVNQLERAASQAKATVGAPRNRAAVAHALEHRK